MPTIAELVGKKVAEGAVEAVFDSSSPEAINSFEVSKPSNTINRQKIDELAQEKVDTDIVQAYINAFNRIRAAGGNIAGHPIFLAVASALTAPLLLGEIGSVLNEKTLMRPLREKVRPLVVGATEAIAAFRRGEIKRGELDKRLAEIGYPAEDIPLLLKVTEFIPGPNDLISFAVREVFTPAIRESFKLDEGFDEVWRTAQKKFRAVGVEETTARDFWAAHWALPSVQQSFEMLHRKEIKEEDLDLVLKAADIMPRFREPLKGIAFQLLTRVDLRRMLKFGILTEDGLQEQYEKLGHDKPDAKRLVELAKALNGEVATEDETLAEREAAKDRDLSRADLLGAFSDGLLERAATQQALEGLGFTKDEAAFLIERELFRDGVKRNRRVVAAVGRSFLNGIITEADARSRLAKLGVSGEWVQTQLETWKLEQQNDDELPTKADVLRWFRESRVTESEAREVLARRGFADKWIKIYIAENLPEKKEDS